MVNEDKVIENYKNAMSRLETALEESGRSIKDVLVIGASKTMPLERILFVRDNTDVKIFGENRVQEMTQKLAENAYDGAPLHFIGHLQRNKVKNVVGKVAMIESVGSLELLAAIDKQAQKLGIVQDILLEVNIGGEEAKSGFAPEALEEAARYAKTLSHVRVLGLMTIPPVENEPQGNLPFFAKMKALYVDINQNIYDNKLKYLSMGTTGDYAEAIEAGSNMVRVGTAIFGARNYSK